MSPTPSRRQTCRAFAAYEREQERRDYSLAHVGSVRTLLDRWPPLPGPCPAKVEAVWDGPLRLPPSPDPARPYVLLVFVVSLDGKVTLDDPADVGGGETDWWLYSQGVRCAVDAVAGGRETMCAPPPRLFSVYDPDLVAAREGELGKPRHPLQVVISGSGAIDPNGPFFLAVPGVPAVIVTSVPGKERLGRALARRPGKHVLSVGPSPRRLDLRRALALLRSDFGVERVQVIGGAGVATALLQAGVVDELFLTQSPRLLGGRRRRTFFEGTGFPATRAPAARLMSLKVGRPPGEDVLFQRWLLAPVPLSR